MLPEAGHSRAAFRLLECFVWLYPAAFRDEYGIELRGVLRQRWRDETAQSGVVGVLFFCAAVVHDILRTACQEHATMLMQDLKFTFRSFRRSPLFAAAAITTMALGIGANTAMFSIVDHALLRPLPFPRSDRLLMVRLPHPAEHDVPLSVADFLDWRTQNRVFENLSAYAEDVTTVVGAGEPVVVPAVRVTSQFFSTLRAHAVLGRTFERGDDSPGQPPQVVLSTELWRARFHADREVIGRSVTLDSKPHTIIGVMDESFAFPSRRDLLWMIQTVGTPQCRCPYFLTGIARMRDGMSAMDATAQLNASVYPVVAVGQTKNKPIQFYVRPLDEAVVGGMRASLFVMLGAILLVLLIACMNVANLFLARSAARQREVLLRVSLGANARRLMRQYLTEGLSVAAIGASVGVFLAYAALRWYRSALLDFVPQLSPAGLDSRALLFTAVAVIFSGVFFGLAPVLHSFRPEAHSVLRTGRGNTAAHTSGRAVLIAGEVAVALTLVLGAGLLVRSFARLSSVSTGTRPEHVITFRLSLPDQSYPSGRAVQDFYSRLIDRVAQLPGVQSAGAGSGMPPDQVNFTDEFMVDRRPLARGEPVPVAPVMISTPNYLQALGIPILRGRGLSERDTSDTPPVAVISRSMAQKYFGKEDPIGRTIKQGGPERDAPWMEIVGVAGDAKYNGLESQDRPVLYKPLKQHSMSDMIMAIRTAGAPELLVPALRTAVASLDKGLALDRVQTMQQNIAESVLRPRLRTTLMAIFAAFALLLAAVGIYGVVAYSVARRTAELGIRMALGAQHAGLLWLVVRQGMKPTVVGLGIGIAGALALAQGMRSLLFGVQPQDPPTLIAAVAVLSAVALLACLVPALRATHIDPVVALRRE
ncbi:MAG: ABC transporter permease [Bryobacteraceae bacterium]